VRADEERPVLRRGLLGPWSSRRARARVRRAVIRERLEAAAREPETLDEHLLERISLYTLGEEALVLSTLAAQPAVTASLRATDTGPGLAAPTTQTENR
jgi:hypothetical protein